MPRTLRRGTVTPQVGGTPGTAAAGQVDFAYHAPSRVATTPCDDLADKLVSRNTGEAIVAMQLFQVSTADARQQHPHLGPSRPHRWFGHLRHPRLSGLKHQRLHHKAIASMCDSPRPSGRILTPRAVRIPGATHKLTLADK